MPANGRAWQKQGTGYGYEYYHCRKGQGWERQASIASCHVCLAHGEGGKGGMRNDAQSARETEVGAMKIDRVQDGACTIYASYGCNSYASGMGDCRGAEIRGQPLSIG